MHKHASATFHQKKYGNPSFLHKTLDVLTIIKIILLLGVMAFIFSLWTKDTKVAQHSVAPAYAGGIFDCSTVIDVSPSECEALVTFYNSTDGSNWKNNTNWLQSDTVASWQGIVLSGGKNVYAIDLHENNLVGDFTLSGLPYLHGLIAPGNKITGASFSGLENLRRIILDQNALSNFSITGTSIIDEIGLDDNFLTNISLGSITKILEIRANTNLLETLPLDLQIKMLDHGQIGHFVANGNCRNTGTLEPDLVNLRNGGFGNSGWQTTFNKECSPQTEFCKHVTDVPYTECRTLFSLYDSTDGPNWTNYASAWGGNFVPALGVASLPGVSIAGDHVVGIQLPWENLSGSVSFVGLPELTDVILPGNNISHVDLRGLTYLSHLILPENQLSSIDLSGFVNLATLDLSKNKLSFLDVSRLINLSMISLTDNNLSNISFDDLPSLTQLYLQGNKLISLDFSGVDAINSLDLSDNYLTALPESLTNLSSLGDLDINNNCRDPQWLEMINSDQVYSPIGGFLYDIFGDYSWQTSINPNCPDPERDALIALYNATDGANRSNADGWDSLGDINKQNLDYCTWKGISCDDNNHVININLDENNLSGVIPSAIHNLVWLQLLDLPSNTITAIEDGAFSGLNNLSELYLNNNNLTNISLDGLPALTELSANNNQLTTISLTNLTNLTNLGLQNNQLSELDVMGLPALTYLTIDNNQIGKLNLSGLTNLVTLEAGSNKLTSAPVGLLTMSPDTSYVNLDNNCLDISTLTSDIYDFLNANQITPSWSTRQNNCPDICVGKEISTPCTEITDEMECNVSYSSLDRAQCTYDGTVCNAELACTPPVQTYAGSPIDYNCTSIDTTKLADPSHYCSSLYSVSDDAQCAYDADTQSCIPGQTQTPKTNGFFITYDTNTLPNQVIATPHMTDKSCAIVNGPSSYTFKNNGVYFFGMICDSIDTTKPIWMIADVSWLKQTSDFVVGNVPTIPKLTDIWYKDDGTKTSLGQEFASGIDTSNYTQKDWQKAIYMSTMKKINAVYNRSTAASQINNKLYIKNINLDLSVESHIPQETTLQYTTGNKMAAMITIPESSALVLTTPNDTKGVPFTGTFITPKKIADTDTGVVALSETLDKGATIHDVYDFGSEDKSGSIYARNDGEIKADNAFTISIASTQSIGTTLSIYTSQDGTTWTLFTGAQVVAGNSGEDNKVIFEVPHLTYYAVVGDSTANNNNNKGPNTTSPETSIPGAGSNGGGGSILSKDQCPAQRDCSDSYYDNLCGKCSLIQKIINVLPFHGAANKQPGSIVGSPFSSELNNAYLRAYGYNVTTMPTIQKANMEGPLLRRDVAKMISNFAMNVLGKTVSTGASCTFADIQALDKTTQYYAMSACRLGLMGYESDGVTLSKTFNPEQIVDRAQFGTMLSRLLRGEKNNGGNTYYEHHLQALKAEGIMNKIDTPLVNEMRGRVMVMMQRIFEKK